TWPRNDALTACEYACGAAASRQEAIAEVSSRRFACRANEVSCFMVRPQRVEGLLLGSGIFRISNGCAASRVPTVAGNGASLLCVGVRPALGQRRLIRRPLVQASQ